MCLTDDDRDRLMSVGLRRRGANRCAVALRLHLNLARLRRFVVRDGLVRSHSLVHAIRELTPVDRCLAFGGLGKSLHADEQDSGRHKYLYGMHLCRTLPENALRENTTKYPSQRQPTAPVRSFAEKTYAWGEHSRFNHGQRIVLRGNAPSRTALSRGARSMGLGTRSNYGTSGHHIFLRNLSSCRSRVNNQLQSVLV